jgi:hypothetical protein
MVGEHCLDRRRSFARMAGGKTRANADMSSVRRVRTPSAESPRFPGRGQSPQGKSEPKARPKGVVDGKRVNIPALVVWSDAGVEKESRSRLLDSCLRS